MTPRKQTTAWPCVGVTAEEAARNITEHFRRFNEVATFKPRIYFRLSDRWYFDVSREEMVRRDVGSDDGADWAAQRIAEYYGK